MCTRATCVQADLWRVENVLRNPLSIVSNCSLSVPQPVALAQIDAGKWVDLRKDKHIAFGGGVRRLCLMSPYGGNWADPIKLRWFNIKRNVSSACLHVNAVLFHRLVCCHGYTPSSVAIDGFMDPNSCDSLRILSHNAIISSSAVTESFRLMPSLR